MPIIAEIDEHRRRFAKLQRRDAYIFDKLSGEARVWVTPEVKLRMPPPSQLTQLEAAHLQTLGVPGEKIGEEIDKWQERIRHFLEYATHAQRPVSPPKMGERIS